MSVQASNRSYVRTNQNACISELIILFEIHVSDLSKDPPVLAGFIYFKIDTMWLFWGTFFSFRLKSCLLHKYKHSAITRNWHVNYYSIMDGCETAAIRVG